MTNYKGIKFNYSSNQLLKEFGEGKQEIPDKGLGPQFIIYTVLKLMELRKILPTDTLIIDEMIQKESVLDNSYLFRIGDQVLALDLINLAIVTQKTSTIFALSKLIREKSGKKVQYYFDKYQVNLSKNALINISGKKMSAVKQSYYMSDLLSLGKYIAGLRSEYRKMLSITEFTYKGKYFLNSSFSVKNDTVDYGLFFNTNNHTIAFKKIYDDLMIVIVLNAPNAYFRDYLLDCLVKNEEPMDRRDYVSRISYDKKFNKEEISINIIGDTYPGEFYTDRRRRFNRWDPLDEKGYDYSFDLIREYLLKSDLNIINLEAALVQDRTKSRLWDLKKFVLGGEPTKTIMSLKNANIHAVLLANNHLSDYEQYGIESTKKSLTKNQISYAGIGLNMKEAAKPLRFEVGNRDIIIFNAYWFRLGNYRFFDMYPGVDKYGVNCLDGPIMEQIRWEKEMNPEAFIIVSPHWGVDFKMTSALQKKLATNLINAGANLIIGHGPHTLQKIEHISGVPVIYSIGNGVFNSDGEYDGYPESVPYGMIANLSFQKSKIRLTLKPIYANNRITKWQPHFVDQEDFEIVKAFFKREHSHLDDWKFEDTSLSYDFNC